MKIRRLQSAKREPSPDEILAIIKAARTIDPELETVVRLAYEAGIPPQIARHLTWKDIDLQNAVILIKHFKAKGPRERHIEPSVVAYLRTLPRSAAYICAKLHGMTALKYRHYSTAMWKPVAGQVSAHSLLWTYREKHERELRQEETNYLLERFAAEFLTEAKVIALKLAMQGWRRLPRMKTSRRLRTREEILGEV